MSPVQTKSPGIGRAEGRRRGNAARRVVYGAAEGWVKQQWMQHCTEYDHCMAAFARDYSRFVANSFVKSNGDPLAITEATVIRWIKRST